MHVTEAHSNVAVSDATNIVLRGVTPLESLHQIAGHLFFHTHT